jgi:hypothetical protein
LYFLARSAKKITAARSTKKARAPMTIPAIAPGERAGSEDDVTALAGAEGMGELDEEDAERELEADVVSMEEDRAAVDDGASVELGAALDIDIAPPMTWARFTTPTLLWQHALLPPQHQRSLSARPVQGVIAVMPKIERVWAHMFMHFPLSMLPSAQKSIKYLEVRC